MLKFEPEIPILTLITLIRRVPSPPCTPPKRVLCICPHWNVTRAHGSTVISTRFEQCWITKNYKLPLDKCRQSICKTIPCVQSREHTKFHGFATIFGEWKILDLMLSDDSDTLLAIKTFWIKEQREWLYTKSICFASSVCSILIQYQDQNVWVWVL